jgi:hypothetical protein
MREMGCSSVGKGPCDANECGVCIAELILQYCNTKYIVYPDSPTNWYLYVTYELGGDRNENGKVALYSCSDKIFGTLYPIWCLDGYIPKLFASEVSRLLPLNRSGQGEQHVVRPNNVEDC